MLPFSWEENIGLIDDFIVIMSSSQKERARKLHCGRSILSPVQLMSDEKPPEPPSAPLRPYWKKSESKGWVIAMLLGFAGLIFLGALGDGAPYLFYLAAIVILPIWPILLIGGIVSGGVSLGRIKRREIGDQPPKEDATSVASQSLPRAQSEESSNQEAEPSQPPSVPQKPDKENGCCLVLIALGLVFGLIYLIGFYFVLKLSLIHI